VVVWRTNVFHAAMRARGRYVTITVSSMSEMSPTRVSLAMIRTRASTGSAARGSIVTVCHPGSRPCLRMMTSM